MDPKLITPLPYFPDSAHWFERIKHWPWPVFLDSGIAANRQGRYDIITARPYAKLITNGLQTKIISDNTCQLSRADPLTILEECLGPTTATLAQFPFAGGAIGFFSYDLSRRFESLPVFAQSEPAVPEMMIGIYDWALVVDHEQQTCHLVSEARHPETITLWPALIEQFAAAPTTSASSDYFILTQPFQADQSFADYRDAFTKIKHYISAGDCYQVNLTQRFQATYSGSPWHAFQHLRQHNTAPYAAYLHFPSLQILSCSPERFLHACDQWIETKPIKGTRPRHSDPSIDHHYAQALLNSAKDRAENLMIVDLLRNDLSKNCQQGSVQVPELFQLESFASVHHLVSKVCGKLAQEKSLTDLLRGCFPGGSITGAPKLRAMQIIEELEPFRRNLYCGSVGYLGFDRQMDLNIAIRTLLCQEQSVYCAAGGAIVHDSILEEEYQESLDKVTLIFDCLAKLTQTSNPSLNTQSRVTTRP